MKIKKPMKVTPANVSRVLTAAGHAKRSAYTSRIRGYKNYSAGFKCEAGDNCVRVTHLSDGYDGASDDTKRVRVKTYMPALLDHFACEIVDGFVLKVSEQVTQSTPARTGGVEV